MKNESYVHDYVLMSDCDTVQYVPVFTCFVTVDKPEGRHRGCHSCSC